MSKGNQMKQIEKSILNLKKSPLCTYRKENKFLPVIGEGNYDASIIFIGEAPGKNEALTGKPFCGASGKVLDELLFHVGLERDDVYITNIVKDRPQNNRDPKPEEIDVYAPFLIKQIEIIKPKVVATLGRFSMDFIMKNFGLDAQIESISKIHGKVFNIKTLWGKVKFVPLYHPAVAVYNRNRLGELKEDFTSLRPRDKGFSTLEVIISIAIASVLLAIVTYSYQTAQIKKTQEGIVEAVYASLQEQKAYTQAGKNGQNYGVKFNSSEFIEFTGTSYSPSSNQNKVSALDPRFEITETITNSDNIIYFSKLLGNANQTATITVSHIDTRVPPQHIVIEQSGTISVIE